MNIVSIKKLQWFIKILQAQIKRWKYKAHSVSHHLRVRHNLLCNPCLCLILKGPRWIEPWMIACTIDFSNWSWKVRIFLIVILWCYLKEKKCKKVIVWRFWYGSICVMVLAQWRFKLGRYMVQGWKLEPDLTCWQALDKETDLLMSGTMQFKLKCLLPRTHQKLQVPCTVNIFWFLLKDEEFVSKTINDSNFDLEKFPASEVRQLAKKMESLKSTC